ncbi:hypothetical protein EDD18DRAFT_1347252 [Armillaria luteobubalina]|uniref:Uncharacterized protein n=1 Tax=Armillaria luteobubalina TaxID=153913 RepID=A0AA39TWU8_9AGAR|nr:hypothetical protein EDD18DRAFT_1347252 [Armillaria luteobubalina]
MAPSDVDDADLSANSLKCHGQVLFVDDEASEASHVSEEPSADEDDYGSDCEAGSEDGTVVLSSRLLSKVKMVKGSYVDALLHSGNVDDVAESDDIKNDLTLTVKGNVHKQSPPTSPMKQGSGPGQWTVSRSKKEDISTNAQLETQVSVDSTSSTLVKTMGMSSARSKAVHTAGNTVADSSDEQAESHTHANPVTPVQPMSSPSKSVAGIKTTAASSVGHGSAKVGASKTLTTLHPRSKAKVTSKKDVEPLVISSDDPDDDLKLAAAPASQITSELAALLGDDVCGSLPEPDDAGPVLCLPKIGVTPYKPGPDLSKPDDPALQVMQPELMEEHLVTLGVYVSLPLLGMYHAVIPMGFTLDTFDSPRFCSFTDMAKLFHLESLTSLVEAFKFEWYGCFVNLACAMPSALTLEGKTLHVSGSNAQGGYASASGTQGGKHVKHLRIMPFHQMFCHESMAWALEFDLEFMEMTCISNRGMSFPTRVEDPSGHGNKNSKYMSAHASPIKGQWRSLTKTLTAESVSPGASYPMSMGFLDEVPIYDGRTSSRNHFLFCPSDFAVLKSFPHFTTSCDLDMFTLISVGYSLSVWTAFNNEPRLSHNILFTIVLGTVPKKEKLAMLRLLE